MQQRVDITIRVVPVDTNIAIQEDTSSLRFTDESPRDMVGAVASEARVLYTRIGGIQVPTRPEEGGR